MKDGRCAVCAATLARHAFNEVFLQSAKGCQLHGFDTFLNAAATDGVDFRFNALQLCHTAHAFRHAARSCKNPSVGRGLPCGNLRHFRQFQSSCVKDGTQLLKRQHIIHCTLYVILLDFDLFRRAGPDKDNTRLSVLRADGSCHSNHGRNYGGHMIHIFGVIFSYIFHKGRTAGGCFPFLFLDGFHKFLCFLNGNHITGNRRLNHIIEAKLLNAGKHLPNLDACILAGNRRRNHGINVVACVVPRIAQKI